MTQFQNQVSNQVTYTISEQQYMAAMRLHFRKQSKQIPLIIGLLLFSGALLISLGAVDSAVEILTSAVVSMTIMFIFVKWISRKRYHSVPQLHGSFILQFSEEGLAAQSSYGISQVKWQLYQNYTVGDDFYLLYQGPQMFNIIPRSAFQSPEQEALFRQFLELNVRPAIKPKRRRDF